MHLVDDVACVSETVDMFVNELKSKGKIIERKNKFRILHNPEIELEKIDFFELMLHPTIRSIMLLMLKTNDMSQF